MLTGIKLVWSAINKLIEEEGLELSGHIAFTGLLALFPFLIFLTSLAGFLGDQHTADLFLEYLFLFVPKDVVETLTPVIYQVINNRRGDLLTIGLAVSLWSAMSGVDALRVALNRAYGVVDHRAYWLRKLQDFAFVLVGSVLIVVLAVLIVFAPLVTRLIEYFLGMFAPELQLWHWARYGIALVAMTAALMLLHRWLPDIRHRFRNLFAGALATTILWVTAASLFSFYLGRFANYGATYGSLGGVIITLLFFYISAVIFIFGGELNAALYRVWYPELAKSALKPRQISP